MTFKDLDSITDLIPLAGILPGSTGALADLYKEIGPGLPSDLKTTIVRKNPVEVLRFNYDEGHAGRYSVLDTSGGSISSDLVMKQPDVSAFIKKHAWVRDEVAQETESELTVFVPGLNTFHEPHQGETTTLERLKHYVRVLGCVPMAQIHTGTSLDQGEARVDASGALLLQGFFKNTVVPNDLQPRYEGNDMVWDPRQIDRLQAALSKYNLIDTPAKKSSRALLELSRVYDAAPVVIVGYSRGAIELEAALRKHIDDSVVGGEPLDEVEQRLRKRVTIVTIGSPTANFPDGPAYVHVAAWTDPLASSEGLTAENNADGAGRDALFLNCGSPYNASSFDNHNFGALTAQFVSVTMFMNGVKGFRALWDKAQGNGIKVPGDSLIPAVIQLTRGFEWLWNEASAWKDIPFGALPSDEEAETILRKEVGEAFVERVLTNFR